MAEREKQAKRYPTDLTDGEWDERACFLSLKAAGLSGGGADFARQRTFAFHNPARSAEGFQNPS